MKKDRFGNPFSSEVPYARGAILSSTEDDLTKLRAAWRLVRERIDAGGEDAVFNLSGLERNFTLDGNEAGILDDEIAPALLIDELSRLALEHMGGDAERHDVMMLNRLTAGLWLAAEAVIAPGDNVIGVSPRYSHPAGDGGADHQVPATGDAGPFRWCGEARRCHRCVHYRIEQIDHGFGGHA
jgi:L-seryl-tRNA(Ser) seleniumtransferase